MDIYDLFARFQLDQNSSQTMDGTQEFIEYVNEQIDKAVNEPHFLYGKRIEEMFGALVVSLGRARFIRKEDTGHQYIEDRTLKVPDYHVVLPDGTRFFVEVKNFYQKSDPFHKSFTIKSSYMESLQRYAEMFDCSLMFAIYWVRWGTWTLVDVSNFDTKSSRIEIRFPEAMMANEMQSLGDVIVGTRAPLAIRLLAEAKEDRLVGANGEVEFKIGGFHLYCGNDEIIDPVEQRIAFFLMLYGRWEAQEYAEVTGGELDFLEFKFTPMEPTNQGFEMIGSLSEMFSRSYLFASTSQEGSVTRTHLRYSPGQTGQLIPDDYSGEALPLWRFKISSSYQPGTGS